MNSKFAHVFFSPGHGRIFLAIERREADFGFGVAFSGSSKDQGKLVAAFFPPRQPPVFLYSIPHDFTATAYVRVDVYRLSNSEELPQIVHSVAYEPAWRPDAGLPEPQTVWRVLAIGFKAGDRDGQTILAAYHGAAAFPVSNSASAPDARLGEDFARAMTISRPTWTFTPLFVWAARDRWDARASVMRAEPMMLVNPVLDAPLSGELRAFLWRGLPSHTGGAPRCALEKAIGNHPRPVAVFQAELTMPGFAQHVMNAALQSSICLAHLSLKRGGLLEAEEDYAREPTQERTYTMRRADPNQASGGLGRGSPVDIKPPSLVEGGGSRAMEIAVEKPGLGDVFILFQDARALELTTTKMPRFEPGEGGGGVRSPAAAALHGEPGEAPLREHWFIAAGEHLLQVDGDHERLAKDFGLETLVAETRKEAKELLGGENALEEGARLLRAGFRGLAAESDEDCTAHAYKRAGAGFDEILAAQTLASFLREIAAANRGKPARAPAVLEHIADIPGLVAVAVKAGLSADPTAIELLRVYAKDKIKDGPFPAALWIKLLGGDPGKADFLALKPPAKQLDHLVSLLAKAIRVDQGQDPAGEFADAV